MKKRHILFSLALIASAAFLSNLCSTTDETTKVKLNLSSEESPSRGITSPPSNVSGYTLTVSGNGMESMTLSYPGTVTEIALDVPSGEARQFTLTADLSSSDAAVLRYRGTASADLVAGATATVTLSMSIARTKIIIPDYLANKVVMINDMTGAGWVEVNYVTAGFATAMEFLPYDVDVDGKGRIYISNAYSDKYGTSSGQNRIVRMDDVTGKNRFNITEPAASTLNGMVAIAIDKKKNLIYYADSYSHLYRSTLDNQNVTTLATTGAEAIQKIYGMDVDPNGILYVSGTSSGGARVFKYDPSLQSVTKSFSYGNFVTLNDIVYKSGYLYVANKGGINGYKIIKLNASDLSFVAGYGNGVATENRTQGNFYDPWHLVAILNDEIVIIDEDFVGGGTPEKLVSMDDINGTNWKTFKAQDVSKPAFSFYYGC